MTSITFAIDEEFKPRLSRFSWINLSELVKLALLLRLKKFAEFKKIVSKSKLTEEDAEEFSDKVKSSMHERLKKRGLL
jgi:hypothetical protein